MEKRVRVRFAPSPTGPAHLGSIRTSLYNYLFAKKFGGDFILRIEDTDSVRFVPGAEEYIIETLKWCGINPNEGFGFGDGPHAPYRQSDRNKLGIYWPFVDRLLNEGKAYYAFDTTEEISAARAKSNQFAYDSTTRYSMRNSLTLSEDETKELLKNGTSFVVRLMLPKNQTINFNDIIRGPVTVSTNNIDDKILWKSSGSPTYHLANVIDDHLMEITHVIRGEEWLPSTGFHCFLYNCFKFDVPEFAHLPLILKPEGQGKFSKRDGAKFGFPAYPLNWTDPVTGEKFAGYREHGFLPDALNNILALFGWSPGDNVEVMPMDEMIAKFDLSKVNKAGARFDFKKATWISMQHMKNADDYELADEWMPDLLSRLPNELVRRNYVARACSLIKERTPCISRFWENGSFFFVDPDVDLKALVGVVTPEMTLFLTEFRDNLPANHNVWDADSLKSVFDTAVKSSGIKPRDAGVFLRAVLCGNKVGPSIFEVMVMIGDDSFKRINKVIESVCDVCSGDGWIFNSKGGQSGLMKDCPKCADYRSTGK